MIKRYITVTGIDTTSRIVDGDRELDQGPIILIVIDRHLESRVVFSIIKRIYPTAILVSSGLISIVPNNTILIVDGNQEDQSIIDDHTLGNQVAISVSIKECFYTSNILNKNLINTKYAIGKLPHLVKLVSAISKDVDYV